ncbi:CDP-diacylglycerol--serine O-phosphatidyltransferase [Spirochaetia bacterium]|nr:CDP-diacylglycerol--serine O-phosphatidyltransferase [Spirochaetia bacterium]
MNKIRGKKRRLKYIAIFPSLVTLMNTMCGFLSIVYASRGQETGILVFHRYGVSFFALSAYMIFFAMIADVLDGVAARLTHTTSSFGAQLDSLSDAISFGVAPAFLMLNVVGAYLAQQNIHFPSDFLDRTVGKAIFLTAILFALCTVIRLARFNVENAEGESDHLHFTGLPSTPSAGIIASLVLFQKDFLSKNVDHSGELFQILESVTTWALPVAALCCGLLMVSRVPYPNVSTRLFRRKKSFRSFLGIAFVIIVAILNIQIALVLGLCGFAIGGVIYWVIQEIRARFRSQKSEAPV